MKSYPQPAHQRKHKKLPVPGPKTIVKPDSTAQGSQRQHFMAAMQPGRMVSAKSLRTRVYTNTASSTPAATASSRSGDTIVTVRPQPGPNERQCRPHAKAGQRNCTRLAYCRVANAVPRTDIAFVHAQQTGWWSPGKMANRDGNRISPPPPQWSPQIRQKKPARASKMSMRRDCAHIHAGRSDPGRHWRQTGGKRA